MTRGDAIAELRALGRRCARQAERALALVIQDEDALVASCELLASVKSLEAWKREQAEKRKARREA